MKDDNYLARMAAPVDQRQMPPSRLVHGASCLGAWRLLKCYEGGSGQIAQQLLRIKYRETTVADAIDFLQMATPALELAEQRAATLNQLVPAYATAAAARSSGWFSREQIVLWNAERKRESWQGWVEDLRVLIAALRNCLKSAFADL